MWEKPSVNHFRVFGCAAYVYLPDAMGPNKLSAKSELMIFVGYDSKKNYIFIRHTRGNAQFISPTATFDETLFPRKEKNATIRSPFPDEQIERELQPTDEGNAPIPSIPVPSVEKTPDIPSGGAPVPDSVPEPPAPLPESPIRVDSPQLEDVPDVTADEEPLAPEEPPRTNRKRDLSPPVDHYDDSPDSPIRSRLRRTILPPVRPGNIYGDRRNPTEIIKNYRRENPVPHTPTSDIPVTNHGPSKPAHPDVISQEKVQDKLESWDPEPTLSGVPPLVPIDQMETNFAKFVAEGGVAYIDFLIANRVEEDIPIQYHDIAKLDPKLQSSWQESMLEELNALHKRGVYELVDLPKGR